MKWVVPVGVAVSNQTSILSFIVFSKSVLSSQRMIQNCLSPTTGIRAILQQQEWEQKDKLRATFSPPEVRWSLWSDQRSFLIWWRRVIQSQMKARYSQLVNSNGWQHRSWRTVKNYLFQSIDRTILETMLKKKTSKEIGDSMRRKYQGSTRVKRAQLQAVRRDFEILQMQEKGWMNDYIGKVMSLASQMRMHGDSITDVAGVEKI